LKLREGSRVFGAPALKEGVVLTRLQMPGGETKFVSSAFRGHAIWRRLGSGNALDATSAGGGRDTAGPTPAMGSSMALTVGSKQNDIESRCVSVLFLTRCAAVT
jgi:hypothetical protein